MIAILVEAAIRALVVALTVWAGLRLLRVANVLALKAAWGLVLAAALAMPLAVNLGMGWHVLPSWAALRMPAKGTPQTPGTQPAAVPATAAFALPLEQPAPAAHPKHRPAPVVLRSELNPPAQVEREPGAAVANPAAAPAKSLRLSPVAAAFSIYLLVCAALLVRMLYGLALAIRLWLRADLVCIRPGCRVGAAFAVDIPLRSSASVASPVTVGSGVILPASYADWDAEKLRIVLAHERSHIRQGDFYLQLLAGLYASLFWFSPLGWWLKRKLSELAETISDRAGLEEAASRSSYAQLLLEFAALPRPTILGVAMARTSTLSTRIDRLLNDSSFRQAFAGGRRALLAVLLVPIAFFAATSLAPVRAAALRQDPPQAPAAPTAGQSAPAPAPAAPEPANPAPAPAPALAAPAAEPELAPLPPPPPGMVEREIEIKEVEGQPRQMQMQIKVDKRVFLDDQEAGGKGMKKSFSYSITQNGESYGIVSGEGSHTSFTGTWNEKTGEAIKKARHMAHGTFLWFTRKDKSYFVDDPAIIAQIEAMSNPIDALGRQQERLERQQAELDSQQEKLGTEQRLASMPTPDIAKEMAELNAAAAKLQAKKTDHMTVEEWADLQSKIGNLQGKLGELEGEIGKAQGKVGELQGELGGRQGKLGAEQGRLGAEQEHLAMEMDRKVRSIIDQSLKDGKAKPVE